MSAKAAKDNVHVKAAGDPKQKDKAKACNPAAGKYEAGSFAKARLDFIRNLQESEGLPWKEAAPRWLLSEERAGLLSGLSAKELARRHFTGKKQPG